MIEEIKETEGKTEATMDLDSHYDHLRIKAEVLPDRTRQTEYISTDGMQRPKKVTRDWMQVRELGSGGNGVVWMERADDGTLRAVKHVQKSQRVASYLHELKAMTKLSKDNVFFVQLHGWFESDRNVHIAMEYFPSGDLSTCFPNPLDEGLVKNIGEQLLEGLTRMHELGIAHRDLKPQNIFVAQIDPIWVKIGDFGISKLVSNDGTALRTSRVGTQGFQAPEVLQLLDDALETSEYTNAVDIWSLGCVLYGLKCRKLPFPGGSLWGYCQGHGGFPESPLRSSGMTTAGVQFLNELLAVDPSKRPSGAHALQSPWILQRDDSSDNLKKTRVRGQGSTVDRIPDTMVPYGIPRKSSNEDFRSGELRSGQTAVKARVPSNYFSNHQTPILNSSSAYGRQSVRPYTQNEQYSLQMRQQDPMNPKQTTQGGASRVPQEIVQAQNASKSSNPHWKLDMNAESQTAAKDFSGSDLRVPSNTAFDDWNYKPSAIRSQHGVEMNWGYGDENSQIEPNSRGESEFDESDVRRTNEHNLEQQRIIEQQKLEFYERERRAIDNVDRKLRITQQQKQLAMEQAEIEDQRVIKLMRSFLEESARDISKIPTQVLQHQTEQFVNRKLLKELSDKSAYGYFSWNDLRNIMSDVYGDHLDRVKWRHPQEKKRVRDKIESWLRRANGSYLESGHSND